MRVRAIASVLASGALALAPAIGAAKEACETIDACLARLQVLAKPPFHHANSLSSEEQELIKRLLTFDGVSNPLFSTNPPMEDFLCPFSCI